MFAALTLLLLLTAVPAVSPEQMESRLAADPASLPATAAALGRALEGASRSKAADYLATLARARCRRLAHQGSWTPSDLQALLTIQLADPERFVNEPAFRSRVLEILPHTLDSSSPARLRDDLLFELNQVRGIDFAASEAIEAGWGAVPRRALERRIDFPEIHRRPSPLLRRGRKPARRLGLFPAVVLLRPGRGGGLPRRGPASRAGPDVDRPDGSPAAPRIGREDRSEAPASGDLRPCVLAVAARSIQFRAGSVGCRPDPGPPQPPARP